jgi:3-oxoacyl-[acyl-carrier protein] reductase
MRVCVVGGGAALAQPLLERWLGGLEDAGHDVVALCPHRRPSFDHPRLTVRDKPVTGQFDLLVTLAGSTDDAKLEGMTYHVWDTVVANTLTAVARAFQSVKVKDGGNVVVVGSIVGSTGAYGAANYAAAKAGLVGLVRSAALEWAGRGVCVNLLELGVTELGMGARLPDKVKAKALAGIPLGRFGTAADFVHAVEFLSTTRWMTGNVLTLAGGVRGHG